MPSKKRNLLAASNAGGVSGQELLTAASGTFVVPDGVTELNVCCIGPGGNGAATVDAYYGWPHYMSFPVGSGSGGGGALCYKNGIVVTSGESITYTIGATGSKFNAGGTDDLTAQKGANASGRFVGAAATATNGDQNSSGGLGIQGAGSRCGGGGAAGSWTGTGASGDTLATVSSGGGSGGLNRHAATADGGGGIGIAVKGTTSATKGVAGSGGTDQSSGVGGSYGAGGAGGWYGVTPSGGPGAIRITWGASRTYPNDSADV